MDREETGRTASVEEEGVSNEENRPAEKRTADEVALWEAEPPLVDDREFLYADERWSRDP